MIPPVRPEPLHETARADQLIADTHSHLLLLFKHSGTCGTSLQALEELEAFLGGADTRLRCALVTVQTDRAVSDHLAARFGIRHQSPQALLVSGGTVVWTASHHRITADTLATAVRDAITEPAAAAR